MPSRFYILNLPPDQVDVNVHPTKMEVRFVDGGRLYSPQLLSTVRAKFLATDLTAYARLAHRHDAGAEPASTAAQPASYHQSSMTLDFSQATGQGRFPGAPCAFQAFPDFSRPPTNRAGDLAASAIPGSSPPSLGNEWSSAANTLIQGTMASDAGPTLTRRDEGLRRCRSTIGT